METSRILPSPSMSEYPFQPFEFNWTHLSVPPLRADNSNPPQLCGQPEAHPIDDRSESPSPEPEHEYTDKELIDFYFNKPPYSPSAEPLVSIRFPSIRASPNRPPTEVASFFPPGYVIPSMRHQLDYSLDIIEHVKDLAIYIGKPCSDSERSEDFWFVRVVDAVGRLVHEANPKVRVYCTEHLNSPLELWNGEPAGISAWPCARHKRWVVKYGMKKVIEFGGRVEEMVVQMPYIRSRRVGVNGASSNRP
ncbi:hypothetical protein CYLTODRAFT_147932 [Cylindrobasidium torrendii FP15055 ss-10]|uniref:Uncharacterized protein n=1 Tax=Cylindrobasidium torrendii FP15055 ss-10 TaxID=1314674 RepID=A0A0D7BLD7_9AGAR|nr:hypothetical protein CYLTODRAFT_147932 [Cylindrobasidium torrendii FP15055 ss-10]